MKFTKKTNKIKRSYNKQKQKLSKIVKHNKTRKGGNFENIKNTLELNIQSKQQNLSKMLSVACKNPDNCLDLGYYSEIIKTYFEDFRNFSYVAINSIKRIGTPSANGFVLEVPFEKSGYKAYTILKCSANQEADNLFYEYWVGKYFINKYIKKYPCFLETYDCYEIKDEASWQSMFDGKIKTTNLNNLLKIENIKDTDYNKFGESCLKNKRISVLIQHFDNFISFHDEYEDNYDNISNEILNILYQVYYPLVQLGNTYTHYDLHTKNVFLYKPYEGKQYITMRYHRGGNIYEFPTEYVVKIIDYGRNYFKNKNTNTTDIIQKVCISPKCEPDCGEKVGYSIIKGDYNDPSFDFYNITPNKPNVSHDLRFAYYIKDYLDQLRIYNGFVYNNRFGTPELTGDNKNNIVTNIFNFLNRIETIINKWNTLKKAKKYDSTWVCVAEMDIYDDGRDYTFKVLTAPKYTISTPPLPANSMPMPQNTPLPPSASVTPVTPQTIIPSTMSTSSNGIFNLSP